MDEFQPPGRLVTLTDVAREAGVGESTVSRVLRNHGSYSKRAGARVAEAVARLGYVPNRLAGSLAGQGRARGSWASSSRRSPTWSSPTCCAA